MLVYCDEMHVAVWHEIIYGHHYINIYIFIYLYYLKGAQCYLVKMNHPVDCETSNVHCFIQE